MSKFTADFETTTDPNDCRVWAFALCEIGKPDNFIYGNSIDEFFNLLKKSKKNHKLYFHNLKFDGEYIISYLFNNGYTYIESKEEIEDNTFTTLISDTGQFYSIEVYFTCKDKKHKHKVTILDSLKIINLSVEKIAKDFDLPIRKGCIDYHAKREIGHELTLEEISYIRNDVEIMSRALDIMFKENLTKMTIGSDALSNYKSMNKNFNKFFPILPYDVDKDIRKSYKGGFTYLNDLYKEKETKSGIVFDKNSMYPAKMKNELLPYGIPVFFSGKYERDILYNLYIQCLSCSFKLKKNKIPCIQLKNNLAFLPNEYIKSSNGDIITLTLTNIDLELFLENYDVENLKYHSGWKFKSIKGLFNNYIDHWTLKKIQAKKDKNGALYKISKLMLNSLYGKFGLNPDVRSKHPFLDDEGVVRYRMSKLEERDGIYIPVASFITSYARYDIIKSSQAISDYTRSKYGKDLYVYSDTDSIHCLLDNGDELKDILDIDDYRLGAWKLESRFKRGKYIRQKCYIEMDYEDNINVTVAGLPKNVAKLVTFENFKKGFTTLDFTEEELKKTGKKLSYTHVKGGVLLVETEFTIK